MRASVIDDLLTSIPEGIVRDIRVGAFWTAVVIETSGSRRCGLASNLHDNSHSHEGREAVSEAGRLIERSARELARLTLSESLIEASIGMATINGLLRPEEEKFTDLNAEEVIARLGEGKRVALVGNFPFISRLRERVGSLDVLEQRPRGNDLPSAAASEVIPQADVLAITGTTLINQTFADLMALRRPEATVLVLGPSTPLSPVMFEHGVHILSGSVVENVEAVLQSVCQGANFRQIHRRGVRLVTMER